MTLGAQIATVSVLLATLGATAVALLGWTCATSGSERRSRPEHQLRKRRRFETLVLGALAAAAAVVSPAAGVLFGVVALNYLVAGGAENVPFSIYGMFSNPPTRGWMLRFEDGDGRVVSLTAFGISPPSVRKRFSTELKSARSTGNDLGTAQRSAAAVIADIIEGNRPASGRLAHEPIRVCLVEYRLEGRRLASSHEVLASSTPRP